MQNIFQASFPWLGLKSAGYTDHILSIRQIKKSRTHVNYEIPKEPTSVTKMDLLKPRTIKESQKIIKRKPLETIKEITKPQMITIYTDRSSGSDCNKEDADNYVTLPDSRNSKHKVTTDKIASNFTSELVAKRKA